MHLFTGVLLERSFRELFFSDASLWHQYRFIAFDIFLCSILIISCKIFTITVISNDEPNEFTIYIKLCRNVTKFYQQELASLFQVQEKIEGLREFKIIFLGQVFHC